MPTQSRSNLQKSSMLAASWVFITGSFSFSNLALKASVSSLPVFWLCCGSISLRQLSFQLGCTMQCPTAYLRRSMNRFLLNWIDTHLTIFFFFYFSKGETRCSKSYLCKTIAKIEMGFAVLMGTLHNRRKLKKAGHGWEWDFILKRG